MGRIPEGLTPHATPRCRRLPPTPQDVVPADRPQPRGEGSAARSAGPDQPAFAEPLGHAQPQSVRTLTGRFSRGGVRSQFSTASAPPTRSRPRATGPLVVANTCSADRRSRPSDSDEFARAASCASRRRRDQRDEKGWSVNAGRSRRRSQAGHHTGSWIGSAVQYHRALSFLEVLGREQLHREPIPREKCRSRWSTDVLGPPAPSTNPSSSARREHSSRSSCQRMTPSASRDDDDETRRLGDRRQHGADLLTTGASARLAASLDLRPGRRFPGVPGGGIEAESEHPRPRPRDHGAQPGQWRGTLHDRTVDASQCPGVLPEVGAERDGACGTNPRRLPVGSAANATVCRQASPCQ